VAVESLLVDTPDDFSKNTPRYIAAGIFHTCAIASDNQAYCWGYNPYGQLGNNSTTNSSTPVAVDTSGVLSGKTINQISTSRHHTCVIASDNQAYCWGYNTYGQLGNNSTTDSSIPVAVNTSGVLNGKTIKSISNKFSHTCVIASDNQAYCWGYNGYGQLGNNSTTDSSIPVAVNTSGVLSGKTINQISANYVHTCAIASDNQAYCWGAGSNGRLGNNSTTNSSVPVAVYTSGVFSGKTINQISAGYYHTCAVASDNQAYCWGRNDYGQLGNISTTNSSVPVTVYKPDVLINKTIDLISNSTYHTCVIASDNQAYCWGRNAYGELGNNSYVVLQSQIPITVYDMPIIEPVQSTGIYRYY
jgi:alpha-tubulin suppressor-like RCC1 family protein